MVKNLSSFLDISGWILRECQGCGEQLQIFDLGSWSGFNFTFLTSAGVPENEFSHPAAPF